MPTTTNSIWDDDNLLAESDATNAINVAHTNSGAPFSIDTSGDVRIAVRL
jgi:hypothetical protein